MAPYTYSHSRDGIWTVSWVGASEIEGFRNGSELILDIDRYSFSVPLNGSAATLTKIEECAANYGHPPGSANQQPAWQSQGAPAQAVEVAPGLYRGVALQTKNWEVAWLSRDPAGKKRLYCEAISIQASEHAIRLAFDSAQQVFQYGFMSYASLVSRQLPVTFWFDNDRSSAESITAQWQTTADGVDWIGGSDSTSGGPGIEESFISNGSVHFAYPVDGAQHVATFSLAGSGDALSRMFDCAWATQ